MAKHCVERETCQPALAVAFANYCREKGETIAIPRFHELSKEDCLISEFPKQCLQEGLRPYSCHSESIAECLCICSDYGLSEVLSAGIAARGTTNSEFGLVFAISMVGVVILAGNSLALTAFARLARAGDNIYAMQISLILSDQVQAIFALSSCHVAPVLC